LEIPDIYIYIFLAVLRFKLRVSHLLCRCFYHLSHSVSPRFIFLKAGSSYIAQADVELTIPLPQPPECWDYSLDHHIWPQIFLLRYNMHAGKNTGTSVQLSEYLHIIHPALGWSMFNWLFRGGMRGGSPECHICPSHQYEYSHHGYFQPTT
jgi:hypothetical protein